MTKAMGMVMPKNMVMANAMSLAKELEGDITDRIRLYSKCIAKTTENYKNWLKEEYSRKLQSALRSAFVTSDQES